MGQVDLASASVIDNHCHPFRTSELLDRDQEALDARVTLIGACYVLGGEWERTRWDWDVVKAVADSNPQALATRRWLAQLLGCDPTREAVDAARTAAMKADPKAYYDKLLADQSIEALIVDNGTPGHIPHDEFDPVVGVPVYRAFRVELWVKAHRVKGFKQLIEEFEREAAAAAAQPRMLAFKSFIHYTAGLDIGTPSVEEARRSYEKWQASGWEDTRANVKPLMDYLHNIVARLARESGKALHFHVGGEGNEPVYGQPFDLYPFLYRNDDIPTVLIHTGQPWFLKTAYLAGTFPRVYCDLSEICLYTPGQMDWVLEMLLGGVPGAKILHGSDECVEPEQIWFGAKVVRGALTRVLNRFVERDLLTQKEAQGIGEGVLAENARSLYDLPATGH